MMGNLYIMSHQTVNNNLLKNIISLFQSIQDFMRKTLENKGFYAKKIDFESSV